MGKDNKQQHAINVVGSKLAAKQDLIEMLWPTLGATLLFFAPYFLLSTAMRLACYGTGTELLDGLTQTQLLKYLAVYAAANLLLVQPLYYGVMQFYALRRAGGHPPITMVTMCLSSWRLYLKSIRMALVLLLFSVLWLIPAAVVSIAAYALYVYVLTTSFGKFLFLEIVILSAAAYISMILQYHCGYALMMEQPGLGCWKAVRTAAKKFRGHQGEVFSLLVSFFFWIVLTIVLGGFLIVVLCPYFMLALFHLFDRIRGVRIKLAEKTPENK
ncbi:MAG: DUF975 family protein [Eubacteriales bacterium]|nr:DUF975 family protein [Eubacteriales bacterium]